VSNDFDTAGNEYEHAYADSTVTAAQVQRDGIAVVHKDHDGFADAVHTDEGADDTVDLSAVSAAIGRSAGFVFCS
jgi:hypothetical protein